MNILLIGNGKWGKNYVSTINNSFSDIKLTIAGRDYWKDLIDSSLYSGVIVATPPESHIEIAIYSLSKNIPTMIEKPLSLSLEDAKQLNKFSTPILVNHIYLFSDGHKILKEMAWDISKINKITTNGYNNGPFRNYSSLFDYGAHDLSIILDLVKKSPDKIEIKECSENLFNISMEFGNIKTFSTIGSGANKKARNIMINYDGIDILYDDLQRPAYHKSPLECGIQIFIDAVNGMQNKYLGLNLSIKVLEILEYCEKQLIF